METLTIEYSNNDRVGREKSWSTEMKERDLTQKSINKGPIKE